MVVKYIHDQLFGASYVLAYNVKNGNLQPLGKKLSTKYGIEIELEDMPESASGSCQCLDLNGVALIVISLEKFNNTPYSKGILAHECFHATEYAFEIRDIKYCKSTSEIWAYNIQMLVEKFSEGSFKKSSRLKKKEVDKIIKFHVGK